MEFFEKIVIAKAVVARTIFDILLEARPLLRTAQQVTESQRVEIALKNFEKIRLL